MFWSSLIYTAYLCNSLATLDASTAALKLNIDSISLLDAILGI